MGVQPTLLARPKMTGLVKSAGRVQDMAREGKGLLRERPFLFYMGAVTTLAAIYFLLIASPLYVSETQIAVRGKQAVVAVPLLAALTGQGGGGLPDSMALQNFIGSYDALSILDKRYHLRELYSRFRLDPLNHLPASASQKDFLDFYNSKVIVSLDQTANILTVSVASFDPKSAKSLADGVVALSSEFVDDLSRTMRIEGTRAAASDLQDAQKELNRTTQELTQFRLQTGELDTTLYGAANSQAIVSMQTQIISLRTQLASLMTYSTPNSPQVKQVNAQIASLQQAIAKVQADLAGPQSNSSVAKQLVSYQKLLNAQLYAQQRLALVQAAYDEARSVSDQKELFVVKVASPNLPDRSTEPRRLLSILSVMIVAAVMYGIGKLSLASIRDHQS